MPSLPARIFTLVFMAWANIYCCCKAAPAPAAVASTHARPHCCSDKPAEPQQPQHHKNDCDECPFLAIRQNTVLTPAQHDTIAPPASPCLFAEPIAPAALLVDDAQHCTIAYAADDPITIPHALLDLRTSLLR